jgi:hypothetical protein
MREGKEVKEKENKRMSNASSSEQTP